MAEELLGRAALRNGERVLDVACGTGIITRLAAEQVGPGKVAGLDLTPGMLKVARSITPSDLAIDWKEGSAETLPFPDASFDVVFCGLGLQFVPNKVTALREMRRVLGPEGRLLLSTPGRMPRAFEGMEGALSRHIGPEAGGFVNAVFSLHDRDLLQTMMSEAGLDHVNVESVSKRLRMPPAHEFVWQYIHSTPLAPAVMAADASKREALEREAVEGFDRFLDQGHLTVDHLIGTARKSA